MEAHGWASSSTPKRFEGGFGNEFSLPNEKLIFLSSTSIALKDKIHTDIQLEPGNNGPPIPAHRAILATRSEIFKNMLDFDSNVCKAPPNDTILLPEFNQEELECFLEFLYAGSLPEEKVEKHVRSLSLAADKYEIPFLQMFCEHHMLRYLNSSNALDVLEISDDCSYTSLKKTVLNFITRNMEDIVFSARYEQFAHKKPDLLVQITRESVMEAKKEK